MSKKIKTLLLTVAIALAVAGHFSAPTVAQANGGPISSCGSC